MKPISLKTIQSFVWRAAFVLLMLVMVSSHFTFRYAAKFTSTATGSDTGKVASFHGGEVDMGRMEPQNIDIELPAVENSTYYAFYATFTLTFEPSEVAREFTFELYHDQPIESEANKQKGIYADRVSMYCPNLEGSTLRRLSPDYENIITNKDATIDELFPQIGSEGLQVVMNAADTNSANSIDAGSYALSQNSVYYGYRYADYAADFESGATKWAKASVNSDNDSAILTTTSNVTDAVTIDKGTGDAGIPAKIVTAKDETTQEYTYTEGVDVYRTKIVFAAKNGERGLAVPMNGAKYEFTFIFFINGSYDPNADDPAVEDNKITYLNHLKYNLDCWQVD